MSVYEQVLRKRQAVLTSGLVNADLNRLSKVLEKEGVLFKGACAKFESLDSHHLEDDVKVRYLIQQVCEGIGDNASAYDKLVHVLSEHIDANCVYEAMGKDIAHKGVYEIRESDVLHLLDILAPISFEWKNIGLGLHLPDDVISRCTKVGDNIVKLQSIIIAWISGLYSPTTLSHLKQVLSGSLVSGSTVAQRLDSFAISRYFKLLPHIQSDYEAIGQKVKGDDVLLTNRDVPLLVDLLSGFSFKWEEIGLALALPQKVIEDCREADTNLLRLQRVLFARMSFRGFFTTLKVLKAKLSSEVVGIHPHILDTFVSTQFEGVPHIKSQSCNIKVAENLSTLLEVQVSDIVQEKYQWNKDGQPLAEGADFSGVCSNILYINRASQVTEGKYTCHVTLDNGTVLHADDISLVVSGIPEKTELLKIYSCRPEVPADSWPPISNSKFIDLALINHNIGKLKYETVKGYMDDILEGKKVAQYHEVFRDYKERALVVLEGRPGCGKSTLVHKLTRDWANGLKVLQGAHLVFLVKLKSLNISGRDLSLLDLLGIFFHSKVQTKKIADYLEESNGKGVCFILDELNDYNIELRKDSIIYNLIFKKSLPLSMIVVASRPMAATRLTSDSDMCIEVVGFSRNQIYSYVESFPFNKHNRVGEVKEYLDHHPNILQVCYLPLHLALICFFFNELGTVSHRETPLYEKLICGIIVRYSMTYKNEVLQLRSLDDLSGNEKKCFHSVCKWAFDRICNSQQLTTEPQDLWFADSALGLVTVDQIATLVGLENVYSFSHITIQDFLAAFYIHTSQLYGAEAKETLHNVWRFYSGLVQSASSISMIKTFFDNSSFDYFSLVRCAYESQNVELCDCLIKDGVLIIKKEDLFSYDCIALGYVISNSTNPVEKIVLENCKWTEKEMMLLASEISSFKLKFVKSLTIMVAKEERGKSLKGLLVHLQPYLEELKLTKIRVEVSVLQYCNQLITLKLTRSLIDSDWIGTLSDAMTTGFTVHFLDLSSNNIGSFGAGVLAKGLKFTNELKSLNLHSNNIGSHGAIALALALQSCSQLELLSLNDNCIGETECLTLKEKLSFCKMLDLNHQKPCNYIDVGRKVVIYNGWSKEILWDKYGFSITLGSCNISAASEVVITAIADAECTLPSNSKLVSGIFHIESSGTINSTSTIQIQHCCPQSKDLTFVHCSDETLEFTTLPGGAFTDTYGKITVNSFSYYAIVSDDRGKKEYLSSLYFSRQPNKHHEGQVYCSWDMHISVVRNCSVNERLLELYYFHEEKEFEQHHSFVAEFDGDRTEVKLSIPCSEIQSGWHIKNINQESIFRTDIDSCICGFPSPITCQLLLYIQQDVSNLNYYLSVDGLKQPNNSFKILIVLPDDKIQLLKACDEMIKVEKHTMDCLYAKIIFLGPPERGKTVTRKRMVNEIVNVQQEQCKEPSTSVIEGHTYCIKDIHRSTVLVGKKNWFVLNNPSEEGSVIFNLFRQLLPVPNSKCLVKACNEEENDSIRGTVYSTSSSVGSSLASPSLIASEKNSKGVAVSPQMEENHFPVNNSPSNKHPSDKQPTHDLLSELDLKPEMNNIWELFKQAIEEDNWEQVSEDLQNMALLYFHDTGGQSELLEMLPALTIGSALYFFFYRLTDDLDDKFTLCYRQEKGKNSIPVISTATVGENLISTLSSIYCMSTNNTETSACKSSVSKDECSKHELHSELLNSKVAVYIMGTYKDRLRDLCHTEEELEEKILEVDKKLKSLIIPTDFYEKKIVHYQTDHRLIYSIDNKNADENDALQLQQFVQDKLHTNFKKLRIPARWLVFSLTLRRLKKSVLSLKSCIDLGRLHNMSAEGTKMALSFFHLRAGILMYFQELSELQDIVIVDVQLVFDIVTKLIVNCLELDEKEGSFKADQCRSTGLFDVSHIHAVCGTKQFPQKLLIILLTKLNIISSLPHNSEQYLMPCLLSSLTDEELTERKSKYRNDSIASLLICFNCGFVPVGIFPSLIARLFGLHQSKEKSFEINNEVVRKNWIEFFVGVDQDAISFVCNTQFYEILFKPLDCDEERARPFHEVCRDVKDIIVESLEEVLSRTFVSFKESYHFGFIMESKKCCCSTDKTHVGIVNYNEAKQNIARKMACKISKKRVTMESRHLVWFNKPLQCQQEMNELQFIEQVAGPTQLAKGKRKKYWEGTTTPSEAGRYADMSSVSESNVPDFNMRNLNILRWKDNFRNSKIIRILLSLSNRWIRVGDLLGMKESTLENIDTRKRGDPESCCREVFIVWMKQEDLYYPPTWKGLHTLLMDLEDHDLARNLVEAMGALQTEQ